MTTCENSQDDGTSQKERALTEEDQRRYRAELLNSVHRELHRALRRMEAEEGLSRADIARRLGVHPSVISRRFNGTANLTLEVIADLSRAMGHRAKITLEALKDLSASRATNGNTRGMTWYIPTEISATGRGADTYINIPTSSTSAKTLDVRVIRSPGTSGEFVTTTTPRRDVDQLT